MKIKILATCLLVICNLFGIYANSAKPLWVEDSIVYGNKRVECTEDGKIRISNSKGVLLEICCPYYIENIETKKIDWGSFNPKNCKMTKTSKGFTWKLNRVAFGKTWEGAHQELEILPDGLLRYKLTCAIPPEGFKLRGNYFYVNMPGSIFEGKNFLYNGKKLLFHSKISLSDYRKHDFIFQLSPDTTNDEIQLKSLVGKMSHLTLRYYPGSKIYEIAWVLNKSRSGELLIDLSKSAAPEKESLDIRGGISFQTVEKLEMPDNTHKNLFQNASFERGLEGYRLKHSNWDRQWGWKPFEIQSKEVFSGNLALSMIARPKLKWQEDYRRLRSGVNITTMAMVVPPGIYTASFYAKCEKNANARIHTWFPNFHSGSYFSAFDLKAIGKFNITPEWKRYSHTFVVKKAMPLEMHINALSLNVSNCNVYIDALQLEQGRSATAFEPVPAEGRLLTSEPENFVSAENKIDGRLLITTAKPNISGKVNIQVKNFFGKLLLNQEFQFKSNDKSTAEIVLPLDSLPGLGVFMVRTDYTLADRTKAFDQHRYAKIQYMNNTHRLKRIFALDYTDPYKSYNYPQILERWRRLGVGSKSHHNNYDKEIYDLEQKYGVEPSHSMMLSQLRNNRKLVGFCFVDANMTVWDTALNDPRILLKDFHHDSNGVLNTEYLERFKNAAKKIASKYPHIPMWMLEGELIAKFPVEWWSKEGTPQACARIHARLLKAFVDGVKEANPNAKFIQEDPCNMRPDGGIAETDLLLAECNKLGVKFDVIGIHPYRFSPESPDLDSDTQSLLKMLAKHGYVKTPVIWPEMMHWGPFNIPQWGTVPSSWASPPRTWPGTLISYDMGWTEKKTAAWYARSWLVALKYSDRVIGATAGNIHNNCYMDVMMTPYAAQLIPNTLSNLLGDSHFKADIRFAPFIRAYVFEDAQKRPVAAIWSHLDKVDDAVVKAPVAETDFGSMLENVIDLMNSPCQFNSGKFRFEVSGFPLFLRGKPGTLQQMITALNKTQIISGEGISSLSVIVHPADFKQARISLGNLLSTPFEGTLNGKKITIPASETETLLLPLTNQLSTDRMESQKFDLIVKNKTGGVFRYQESFDSLAIKHLPDNLDFKSIDWQRLPAVEFVRREGKPNTSGDYRLGWNRKGLFIQAQIKDPKFVHVEYSKTASRWCNDCMQFYIDTMADARIKRHGYDENDYDYALFPNTKGNSSIVFRYRSVEQQLGLATQAPPDNTVASDIPSSFTHKDGISTYRVFVPAKYLLPFHLEKGKVFGFGLYVPDAIAPQKISGALTIDDQNKGCYNRPHTWPIIYLSE